MHPLIHFLQSKMRMTDVYQPVVIRELLSNGGSSSKSRLAASLVQYDASVQEYYQRILMRWPKATLTKHGIVSYDRATESFALTCFPDDDEVRQEATALCDLKIEQWITRKRGDPSVAGAASSVRYELLKEAKGCCRLCGIHSSVCPLDIDHIIPQSRANKAGKVYRDDRWIDVNDRSNLQVLCFRCNRAKRDGDTTDFSRRSKLVRDRIPEIISAQGRKAVFDQLHGSNLMDALRDKLVEEHAEFIAAETGSERLLELVDMYEVVAAIASKLGFEEDDFQSLVRKKRTERGSFSKGLFLRPQH